MTGREHLTTEERLEEIVERVREVARPFVEANETIELRVSIRRGRGRHEVRPFKVAEPPSAAMPAQEPRRES